MRKGKKMRRNLVIAIIVMFIALGFALLSTTLDISGFYGIRSMNWDIHFENVILNEESYSTNVPTITNGTQVDYQFTLNEPTDFYEFTVDAVNDGTMDAIISVIENGAYDSTGENSVLLPDYLEYSITNSDNSNLKIGQVLPRRSRKTYIIRVNIKSGLTMSELPEEETNIRFKLSIQYVQKKSNDEADYAYYDGEAKLSEADNEAFLYQITDPNNKIAKITYINGDYKNSEAYDTLYNSCAGEYECSYYPELEKLVIPAKVKLDGSGNYDSNGTYYTITNADIVNVRHYESDSYSETSDYNSENYYIYSLFKEIILPNTLTSVSLSGNYSNLERIKLSKNLTVLPDIIVKENYNTNEIIFPTIKIPSGVTTLYSINNYGSCSGSPSQNFTLGVFDNYCGVEYINENHNYESMTNGYTIYIPSTVTTINNNAMHFEAIKKIYVENKTIKGKIESEIDNYCNENAYYYLNNFYQADEENQAISRCKEYNKNKIVVDRLKFQ